MHTDTRLSRVLLKVKGSPTEQCLAELAETAFPVFRKASSKNCFQFKPSQHQAFKVFLRSKIPELFRKRRLQSTEHSSGPAAAPVAAAMDRGRWISLTAAGAKVSWPHRAATLAELDTCKTVLSLRGRTQICALAQEHRNTLSPSINQGSEGFHTRSLIFPVSGNLGSIAARGFTAACPKILSCSSPRQL